MTNTENNIKKFEGFLDKMRGLLDSARKQGHIIIRADDLENAFPELKESEDERIRNALIDLIKSKEEDGYMVINNFSTGSILAWLEKQKEFVSTDFDDVWETADCDKLTAPLEIYSKDAIKEMCHAWYDKGIELERKNWIEKQGEHKSTDNLTQQEAMDIAVAKCFDGQKSIIEMKSAEESLGISSKEYNKIVNECLYGEQKSAEWSEEDEHRLKDIIYFLDTAKKHYASTVELDACIDWLKSLKDCIQPQNHWKPSEEHVHWLKWAINRLPDTEKANEAEAILEDLLKQLKEL